MGKRVHVEVMIEIVIVVVLVLLLLLGVRGGPWGWWVIANGHEIHLVLPVGDITVVSKVS